MCKKIYICTDHSKWDTCRVEKMGCPGCNYFRPVYKLAKEPKTNNNIWKRKE